MTTCFSDNMKMQRKNVALFCESVISLFTAFCTLSSILGAFAKYRKATIAFVMSVRPSAWNLAPTGRNFVKADIWLFFSRICPENSSLI